MESKSPSSSPGTQVKKENEEEIKEYAETAMNELLGWYGYERLELRRWAASRARDAASPENAEQKTQEECSWCNKSITGDGGALQQAGAVFCSEICFSQSRRANFKRAKTCDWCRHVRHTVAYVDFQDGATQLQFCSDKCLNQYKMHIFCRETQAHLDLNPHLISASSSSNLITPELWLKNCKSRSPSPNSERSKSPNIETNKGVADKVEQKKAPSSLKSPAQPLISVAPPSKLMKHKMLPEERVPLQKSPETKKESKNKMNLRKRRTSKCSTVTSQSLRHTSTPKAQDLRMCSPSLDGSSPSSTIGSSAIHSPPHPINPPVAPQQFPNAMFGMPPPNFIENYSCDPRLPIAPPSMNFIPRPNFPFYQERPRMPPVANITPSLGQLPPVTVLVPYPVVIPIPLPIPIPIPLSSFIQAHRATKLKNDVKNDDSEGPLDFTMNNDKKKDEDVNINDVDKQIDEKIEPTERLQESERNENDMSDTGNPEQTLPKFKITRLGNKIVKILPKVKEPPESTRPLRKRRRLVEVATDEDVLIPKTRKTVEV